jgi:hypothetical protein
MSFISTDRTPSFRVTRDESLDELDVADQTNTSTIRSKVALATKIPTIAIPFLGVSFFITSSMMVGGLVAVSSIVGGVTCQMDTAANIIAALTPYGFGKTPGDSYSFVIGNYGGNNMTLTDNVGVTLTGGFPNISLVARTSRTIVILYTSPTTVTVY